MAAYPTENIRNIAFAGQAGSGKTSLIEALLVQAGAKPAQGTVEKGDTTSDFDTLEQRHQHSLQVSVIGFEHRGRRINLIDTPGYPDFLGQTLSALSAVETIAVVVNAQTGIEPMTRRMMDWVVNQHVPCMIIVNKIDAEPDRLQDVLDEISAAFGKECLPLDLPADHARRVVDVVSHADGTADFSSVAAAHAALLEQTVEVDETATEQYLTQGDMSPAELHAPFEQALREGHLIPVCFASARTGAGVTELLDAFAELAPSPLEANPYPFIAVDEGQTTQIWAEPDPSAPLLAHVFKLEFDPFIGKIGLLRIHQGRIRKGGNLLIGHAGKSVKVTRLLRVNGKEHQEIEEAAAGDICAIAKLDEIEQDSVLHDTHDQDRVDPPRISYPTPLVGLALKAKRRGDEQKITEVLHKLVAEDPGLRIDHDMSANETVLRGLGDFHLRVALEKLDERFHVEVETHPPTIPYRETITRPADGFCRHKKQTGGAGQFAEVQLQIEPLPRGGGFEFVDRITGGAIPGQFIPAIEKGVRQTLASGAIAGFPLQDVRVTVVDGKFHSVDSKEIAFITAGRKAFIDAVGKAGAVVLEPIAQLEVTAPGHCAGAISGDLSSRRARIGGTDAGPKGEVILHALAPLAELQDYGSRLKSLTGGEGNWGIQFSHYEPAPPTVQKELVARHKPRED
ncbi:MAG: elongation factor G [Methylotetracoccus sp.]